MQDSTFNSSFSTIRFRILILVLTFFCISIGVNAQTDYIMPTSGTTTVNVVTGDRFFDSGGSLASYSNNENGTITLNSSLGTVIQVVFEEFDVEDAELKGNGSFKKYYDNLKTYDGGVSSSSLGVYYGSSAGNYSNKPTTITSSGNQLTFSFISDTYLEEEGWEAVIEVLTAPCSAGSSEIWTEDFESNSPKGTSSSGRIQRATYPGNGSGGWGMVGSNIDNVRTWESDVIDISTYKDMRASMDVGSWGNKMEDSDNISISYSVDGGDFVNFSVNGSLRNDIGTLKACANIPDGNALVIKVSMYNTANNEFYYCDNVVVSGELNVIGNLPNAICKNQTIQLDALGNASIAAADINNGSNDVETADADLLFSLDQTSFDCSDLGSNTVTLTVEDEDGNKSTCTSTVTVEDNISPSFLSLNAEYHDGRNLTNLVYSEALEEINFSWGNGSPNTSLLGNDTFSVRFSGSFVVSKAGNYTFYTTSDDGVRLSIDGSNVINNWTYHAPTENTASVNLTEGEHTISLDYFESGGGAVIQLEWESVEVGIARQVFSQSSLLNNAVIETTLQLNAAGTASLNPIDVDPGFIDACGVTSRNLSKSSFTSADIGTNIVVLTVEDASGNSTSVNVNVTVQPFIPEVSLSVDVNSIGESGGNAFLTATLNGTASTDVLVDLAITGTASTSDYSISKLQIVVPAGNLSASQTVSAVNDTEIEGDENLNVSVSNVTGGTEQGSQMVMITIVDDDFPSEDKIEVNRQSPEKDYTPDDLVQNVLVTGCLKADNVTYSGDDKDGVGYFNAGTSDFPLSSGVIISTGKVRNAEGKNDGGNESDNIDDSAYDADVARLASGTTRDAQILEFDFVPAGDKLEFRYIFASDEYHEFVGSAYNDVFGFILSGPGINGSFTNGGENIALIPNSTNNVSINNVNRNLNSLYYQDTPADFATSFDGRTTVLTARANVTPCETYHIRLIISDVFDNAVNSAVFLEAESFKSNEVEIQNGIGVEDDVDFMYEGCGGSYIKFVRKEDFEEEMTFDLNISGSAENGVDYLYVDAGGNQIGDGKIPTTVTLPAGMDELVYYYKALSDDDIEGDEELRLSFLKNCPCSAPDYYEKVVTIIDVPEIEASPTSLVSCMGATPVATITVDLKSGLDPSDYQYSLDGGAFQDNNVFTLNDPVVGETHTIGVQDRFACQSASFDIVMPEVTPIAAEAGPSKTICEGETVQLEGGGGIYYEWSCSPKAGLAYLNNINAPNPTVAADIPFGSYTYTLTVKESSSASASCIDTDNMVLTVNENSHFTISTDKMEYCSGEVVSLNSVIQNSDGSDSYLWTPAADVVSSTSANTTVIYSTATLAAKDFSLTVTKSNGCSNTENISGVFINPYPVVSLNASSNQCSTGSDGVLDVDVSGGTPYASSPLYDYSWSHDGSLNSSVANNLNSGSYTITVRDAKSCSESKTFSIGIQPVPKGIYHE